MKYSISFSCFAVLLVVLTGACSNPASNEGANKSPNVASPAANLPAVNSTPVSTPISTPPILTNRPPASYSNRFSANDLPSASRPSNTGNASALTMAEYNKLQIGMDYSEVVKTFGREGVEVMKSDENNIQKITYKWEGEKYVYIVLTFENSKLTYKSQANLDKK